MAYEQRWSSDRPGCLIILIDQSGSMSEAFGANEARSKAEVSATVVNKALAELVDSAVDGSAIRDRFDVAVVGYGGAGVLSAFGGELRGVHFATASELSARPLRIEERPTEVVTLAGDIVRRNVKFRVWLDPVADSTTPMRAALTTAYELASGWTQQHQDSFPPVVLNVTDGMPTDAGDDLSGLLSAVGPLRDVETRDGSLLLWTCHITAEGGPRISWPSAVDTIPHSLYDSSFR